MRRLKAFISSTMLELHNERLIMKKALEKCRIESFVFESDAGARPESPRQAYLDEVADSDLYIGIFWNRYSAPTIEEFEYAKAAGKPSLVYVKSFDIRREPKLEDFLKQISLSNSGITYRCFDNVIELTQFAEQDALDWLVREWRRQSEKYNLPAHTLRRLEDDLTGLINLSARTATIELIKSEGPQFQLQYQLKGIIDIDEQGKPNIGDQHLVEFTIPKGYPYTALPFAHFQTPIFHPNVFIGGNVCMGWFGLPYELKDVCIHVARMIDYQVFNTVSPSNREAAQWAENNRNLFPLSGQRKLTDDL